MKLKNKGKVYPSPSSSSSGEDCLSILKVLPAAILALVSVLSLEDREVLAYLVTRSLKTSTTTTKKRSSQKPPPNVVEMTQGGVSSSHKPPVFDCDCFDCYTGYWFRWDSSPNRELIHQVIEAFEDHLTNGEVRKPSKKNVRPKRRDVNSKTAASIPDIRVIDLPGQPVNEVPVLDCSTEEAPVFAHDVTSKVERDIEERVAEVAEVTKEFPVTDEADQEEQTTAVVTTATATSNHKGLARKVLPDVLGLFNSGLWGLWNPNL